MPFVEVDRLGNQIHAIKIDQLKKCYAETFDEQGTPLDWDPNEGWPFIYDPRDGAEPVTWQVFLNYLSTIFKIYQEALEARCYLVVEFVG